jgi:hypothetical protein
MPNIAEQVVKDVAEGLQTYGFRPLDSAAENLLKGQIIEIVKDDHKIRQLVRKLTSFIVRCFEIPPVYFEVELLTTVIS